MSYRQAFRNFFAVRLTCRQDSQGREAGRLADRATDQVRIDHQHENCESAWNKNPGLDHGAGNQGY
jgi:hypothetical protein